MTENSVRHIETLRELDSMKKEYQIRCSHYELELFKNENRITCVICGKNWDFWKNEDIRIRNKLILPKGID